MFHLHDYDDYVGMGCNWWVLLGLLSAEVLFQLRAEGLHSYPHGIWGSCAGASFGFRLSLMTMRLIFVVFYFQMIRIQNPKQCVSLRPVGATVILSKNPFLRTKIIEVSSEVLRGWVMVPRRWDRRSAGEDVWERDSEAMGNAVGRVDQLQRACLGNCHWVIRRPPTTLSSYQLHTTLPHLPCTLHIMHKRTFAQCAHESFGKSPLSSLLPIEMHPQYEERNISWTYHMLNKRNGRI